MKLLRIAFKKETAAPMVAVVFGSCICVALVVARMIWTRHLIYGFLIWNLFLAWMPLLFAFLAQDEAQTPTGARWRLAALAGAWLLFFPNAPYILTDLIHLTTKFYFHFWIDLTLILLCAFTGFVLGFLSLYLMQSLVVQRFGRIVGWLFVMATAALSSLGVYLGRFLRFNSWDVVVRPGKIYHRLDAWLDGPMLNHSAAGFLLLFATFLFITYVMLYALTHLSPAAQLAAPVSEANNEP
jgi:uncharacterized membrane protein